MKVRFSLSSHKSTELGINIKSKAVFTATLEKGDRNIAFTNGGREKTILTSNSTEFLLPISIIPPHPDLLALAALKIFSPYIGNRLKLENPVSERFAAAVKAFYPHIKFINSSRETAPRSIKQTVNPGISFSGGADSVAAASVMHTNTPLILLLRKNHPALPDFESWYKTCSNHQTLKLMSNSIKLPVLSDLEFMSTNLNYCIYPDTYVFTIPVMLVADTLNLSHLVSGDIWAAFTGDETIHSKNLSYRRQEIFAAAGLPIEYPLNGIGEVGSYILAEKHISNKKCTTCQYGEFQKPCMSCIKCFRKNLIRDALSGSRVIYDNLDRFNSSPVIQKFSSSQGRAAAKFAPTYKWCFDKVSYQSMLSGAVSDIYYRSKKLKLNTSFCDGYFSDIYNKNRPVFINQAKDKIDSFIRPMTKLEKKEFLNINWKSMF